MHNILTSEWRDRTPPLSQIRIGISKNRIHSLLTGNLLLASSRQMANMYSVRTINSTPGGIHNGSIRNGGGSGCNGTVCLLIAFIIIVVQFLVDLLINYLFCFIIVTT